MVIILFFVWLLLIGLVYDAIMEFNNLYYALVLLIPFTLTIVCLFKLKGDEGEVNINITKESIDENEEDDNEVNQP